MELQGLVYIVAKRELSASSVLYRICMSMSDLRHNVLILELPQKYIVDKLLVIYVKYTYLGAISIMIRTAIYYF